MSRLDGALPAFPLPAELCQDLSIDEQRGMTLRDYFAAKAMAAFIAADVSQWPQLDGDDPSVSSAAYELADAMLAERAKK